MKKRRKRVLRDRKMDKARQKANSRDFISLLALLSLFLIYIAINLIKIHAG